MQQETVQIIPKYILATYEAEKENMKHKTQSKLSMNYFPSTIKDLSAACNRQDYQQTFLQSVRNHDVYLRKIP